MRRTASLPHAALDAGKASNITKQMGNANCVLLGNGRVSLTRLCSLAKIARSVNSRTSLDRLSANHARMAMSPGCPERPIASAAERAHGHCPEDGMLGMHTREVHHKEWHMYRMSAGKIPEYSRG